MTMLSAKCKYGLKAMVYMARHSAEGPILISDIAQAERIPKKFLDVILLELKTHCLLSSKKGKGGGYQLARPAEKIVVGDIVRILDGPLAPVSCVSRTAYRSCDDCGNEHACVVRAVMVDVHDAISSVLDNATLADMASRRPAAEPVLLYDI
jgi:Rrf2 family protein